MSRLSIWRRHAFPPAAAALAVLLVHGFYVLASGPVLSWDARVFSGWADDLRATGFDYLEYLRRARFAALPRVLYAGFVTLVAFAKVISNEGWHWIIVIFNVVCSAGLAFSLSGLAWRLSGRTAAAWTAAILYVGALEIAWWARFPVSDVSFMMISFGTWLFFCRAFLSREPAHWVGTFLAALVAASYRPPGFLILPILGLGFLLRSRERGSGIPTKAFRSRLLAGALLVALTTIVMTVWVVRDPRRWPFDTFSRAVHSQAEGFARGEVVGGRPEIARPAPRDVLDYLLLIAERNVTFYRFSFPGYSRVHVAANAMFFIPLYVGVVLALARLIRSRRAPTDEEKLLALSAVTIALFALFHSLTHIDSALRYRLPVLAHLILLSAHGWCGIAGVWDRGFRRLPLFSKERGTNHAGAGRSFSADRL